MLPGTGLPANILTLNNTRVKNILVEITSITDIGVSAFTLGNSRSTRMERADLADIYEGEGEEEVGEEEGKIPKYPRSMLKMELSDGAITLPAIEYRPMTELELGVTKLGYKVCVAYHALRILYLTVWHDK
jgi:RecQ-mediated genome instability protein 1